ncbi:Component of a membrane-bound complex containing the Tor2p kinase [Coemansia biformis]|uniref:Component of a membrane-bound complex containing the Tor2p kinase n=1 Tax=Coemansia biformis TaxID=1286918 RepID=A0A9W7Y9C7_9FUNG|nr:Component of a membrane-bound complex containing the Tor2p kinase [Coemansia biformis]
MSLLTDPAFLVYQLRVSFLRTNDPTGGRLVTFDDLSVPQAVAGGGARARHGSTPSPMTPPGRRKTSASEMRHQVALNAAANAYIMACGHYPETDAVGSPDIEYDEGYMYSRGAPRLACTAGGARANDAGAGPPPSARYPDGAGAPDRNKRTNRSAKIAPTGEGREEVVGLGVVPSHPEMMLGVYGDADAPVPRRSLDTVRRRPLPAVAEAVDSGSLSDGAQGPEPAAARWAPEPMPPRRSLDTIRRPDHAGDAPPAVRRDHMRRAGHTHSSSTATIRLQRPHELLRKGSSRDAIALGIDFDVKSMFEDGGADGPRLHGLPEAEPAQEPTRARARARQPTEELAGQGRGQGQGIRAADPPRSAAAARPRPRDQDPAHTRKKSAAGIELRARRNEPSLRIPLASLREERGAGSALLKRSATLPTKRTYAGGHGGTGAAGLKSKWVGAYAEPGPRQAAGGAPGWVGGARDTGWDHSSDDDDVTPLSRRGANTQTWFGPRAGIRPISMYPAPRANVPLPLPPVPLMFGADDSDDGIDLEGDEGSSRTPAALGLGFARGLRPYAPSPSPSPRARSRGDSAAARLRAACLAPRPSALAMSVPLVSPLTSPAASAAGPGALHSGMAQNAAGSRPRGISDPEGLQSSRSSHVPPGASRPASKGGVPPLAGAAAATTPPVSSGGGEHSTARSLLQLVGAGGVLGTGIGGGGGGAGAAEYAPPPVPASSGLAALLATKMAVSQNPFSEEFGAVGGAAGEGTLTELCLFVQDGERKSRPLTIRVRKAATVEQAIGHALYQYIESDCEPKLADDVQDVVMWSLRIAMDGEVDDDFPAFDRTLPVANFAFDEFALCRAGPDQIRVNEGIRVRQGRPPRIMRPKSPAPQQAGAGAKAVQPDKQGLLYKIVPRTEGRAAVLQPSRMATASTAGIFVGSALLNQPGTSLPLAAATAAAGQEGSGQPHGVSSSAALEPSQARLLKIHVRGESSSAHALRATTIEASPGTTIRTVLAQVCRKRQLLEDQYVLGILESTGFAVCSSDMLVAHVPQGAELYLHRVGTALPSLGRAQAPIYGQQQPIDGAVAPLAPEASAMGVPSAYYTFRVTRRAQMFTRHERSLVIDGETITLLPADHRTEPAKTLTFHISNVICKRNQKSPRKIRLFITRRGNTGDKSVDLEAPSEEDAASICGILVRLREAYTAVGV